MQPHPVPQNVTAFQFKLVGDMTLKQFLYLASGVGLAYLIFVILAAPAPFLAWPLIVIFSFLGVAFAFIPLAERPFDHWVKSYLKAVYSPTKMIWQSQGKLFSEDPLFKNRLNIYLSTQLPSFTVQAEAPPPPPPPAQVPPPELPKPEELSKTVELGKEAQALQVKIIQTERELAQVKTEATQKGEDPQKAAEEFNIIFNNLQGLVKEAQEIRGKLREVTKEETIPALPKVKISIVTPPKPKATQLVLTSLPNVINGIVTDAAGNYLDGAVVVIHDKDGLPVRALKSNKLGQFTGATPLPNGTYTVELEKESLSFDVLRIELTGTVLPPFNIAAKKLIPS